MNEFVCYREGGKLQLMNAGDYASIREWGELCEELGVELIGIGQFSNEYVADEWYRRCTSR